MENKYWIESMACVLDEAGVVFTTEQLNKIADGAQRTAEMESEACGHHFIPNPLQVEVDNLKTKIKAAEIATEKQRQDFVANICKRRHCHPSQVELTGDGNAIIY